MSAGGGQSSATAPARLSTFTHLSLVIGAFFSALGFAGALHLDAWLAAWAVEPMLMFRAVAHALFFWLPRLDWLSPELATLYLLFYAIALRGLFVEGTFAELRSDYRNADRSDRLIGLVTTLSLVIGVPPAVLAAIGFLQEASNGNFTLWGWVSSLGWFDWYLLIAWLFAALFVVAAAPRTLAYFFGFLALFYGWGLFVSQPPEARLPMPSSFNTSLP